MAGPMTPALPGALRGASALLLTIAAVALWRFASFPIGAIGALVALVACWRTGEWLHGDRRWVAAFAAMPAAVSLLLALARTRLWPHAWPCDLACQGGARYGSIHGVPLPAIACVAWVGLLLAVGATRWRPPQIAHQRSAPTPRYLELVVWLAVGASLFFIWTAWRLAMPCAACGAYHTTVLATGCALRAGRLRLGPRWLAMIAGAAAPLLIFGWHLLRDMDAPPPGPSPAAGSVWRADAERGLTWGEDSAPLTLDLGMDLQCPRCSDEFPQWEDALDALIAQKRLRVRIRFLTRPSEPAGPDLDAWVLAASAHGRGRQALRALLGTREDATPAEVLRSPAAELVDLPALRAEADAHRAEAAAAIACDARALRALGYDGRTPFAALSDRTGVRRRWSGSLDAAELAAEVARSTAPGGPHG